MYLISNVNQALIISRNSHHAIIFRKVNKLNNRDKFFEGMKNAYIDQDNYCRKKQQKSSETKKRTPIPTKEKNI